MQVRDAVEEDADALARLADAPSDVLRNVVHDRTVRVAVTDVGGEIMAFVSFDASPGTVHVTQLRGAATACERLIEEPVRFAAREGMAVELLVAADDNALQSVAQGAGFEQAGKGPRFDGTGTVRYRWEDGGGS